MDDGDEIIVLRVSTIDLSGKKRLVGLFLCFTQQNTENRFYLQQTLRKEESQSKERSNVVMNKIMAAGGPDMRVSYEFI